jgi:putative photosynthetic complex assembly protein
LTASVKAEELMQSPIGTTRAATAMVWPMAAIVATLLITVLLVFNAGTPDTVAAVDGNRKTLQVTREVRFEDQADGSIRVLDAARNAEIERIAPASNGFLRGAVRGLVRERKRQGIDASEPFTIATLASGRLVLLDRATGREIDLASFGSTNAGVFANLLSVATPSVAKATP